MDRDQEFLLPPDMREWLPEDHLVWFLIAAVERMDTSVFHGRSRLGGVGRRGYDPVMLLTLFLYAMAVGESSSRQIERLCRTDVAFRVICAQDAPDHTVLARFRSGHEEALTSVLTQSLVLAARLGLVSLGVVALDGTKIGANASKEANRSEASLRRLAEQFVERGAVVDAAEDARFGPDRRGDELPEGLADPGERAARIGQALEQIADRKAARAARAVQERAGRAREALDQIEDRKAAQSEQQEAEQARAREFEAQSADGVFRRGRIPQGADRVLVARARWETLRQEYARRYEAYHADRAAGITRQGKPPVPPDEHCMVRGAWARYQAALAQAQDDQAAKPEPVTDPAEPEAQGQEHSDGGDDGGEQPGPGGGSGRGFQANLTDPASRLMKTRDGFIQGFNAQTVTSQDVFILGARVTQDANDVGQFVPSLAELEKIRARLAQETGRADLDQVGLVLADAGYHSPGNLTVDGPDRLIPIGKSRDLAARAASDPATGDPPAGADPRQVMDHRLRTPEGLKAYRQRSHLVETPNAWLKDRRGLRRFSRRGQAAAQAELALAAGVTNLLRLIAHGITTTQLRTA